MKEKQTLFEKKLLDLESRVSTPVTSDSRSTLASEDKPHKRVVTSTLTVRKQECRLVHNIVIFFFPVFEHCVSGSQRRRGTE